MPKKCAVFGCSTNRHHYEVGIRFFHIPREDEDLQLRWLNAIGRSTEWKIPNIPTVCDKHFAPEQMVSSRILAPNVVPTLNLPPSQEERQSRPLKHVLSDELGKTKVQRKKVPKSNRRNVQEPEMVLVTEATEPICKIEACCRLCLEELDVTEGWRVTDARESQMVRDAIWDLCWPREEPSVAEDDDEQKICDNCWSRMQEFENFVTICHQHQGMLSGLTIHQAPKSPETIPIPNQDTNSDLPPLDGLTIDQMLEVLDKIPAPRIKPDQASADEECWDCGKMFPNRSQKKEHRKTCAAIGTPESLRNRSQPCEICGRQFDSRHGLRMHLQKVHMNEATQEENASEELKRLMSRKRLQCPLCPDRFEQLHMLKYHLKTHKTESQGNIKRLRRKKGDNSKPTYCELCNKTFQNPSYLELHMKFHRRERDFGCDQCDKSFFIAQDLKHHKMAVHEAHTILCVECGKTFGTQRYFKRHMLTHSTDPNCKPFQCSYCSESFYTAVKLRDHVTRHTGERAHMCEHCDQAFRYRHQLTQHKIKKHGMQLDRQMLAKVDTADELVDEQSMEDNDGMQEYTLNTGDRNDLLDIIIE